MDQNRTAVTWDATGVLGAASRRSRDVVFAEAASEKTRTAAKIPARNRF
ncbi:MAG: hypothetical protein ABSF98_24125 [Bryobacteraceae bacterium]|jgi:hypothetical protein